MMKKKEEEEEGERLWDGRKLGVGWILECFELVVGGSCVAAVISAGSDKMEKKLLDIH